MYKFILGLFPVFGGHIFYVSDELSLESKTCSSSVQLEDQEKKTMKSEEKNGLFLI